MRFGVSLFGLLAILAISASAQANQGYVLHPNQEVRIAPLPTVVAGSSSEPDVVAASLAIAMGDPAVCCDRNSALADQLGSVTTFSLKELGEKLHGKRYLNSGSAIIVTDQYWPASAVTPEDIVGTLLAHHVLLAIWNGHLYVVYGAVFNEYIYDSGVRMRNIQKLLLLDARFDDDRRYLTFNRQTDDWSKVGGLLFVTITK